MLRTYRVKFVGTCIYFVHAVLFIFSLDQNKKTIPITFDYYRQRYTLFIPCNVISCGTSSPFSPLNNNNNIKKSFFFFCIFFHSFSKKNLLFGSRSFSTKTTVVSFGCNLLLTFCSRASRFNKFFCTMFHLFSKSCYFWSVFCLI